MAAAESVMNDELAEAPMAKLRAAGFARMPTSLEAGVSQYVRDLGRSQ